MSVGGPTVSITLGTNRTRFVWLWTRDRDYCNTFPVQIQSFATDLTLLLWKAERLVKLKTSILSWPLLLDPRQPFRITSSLSSDFPAGIETLQRSAAHPTFSEPLCTQAFRHWSNNSGKQKTVLGCVPPKEREPTWWNAKQSYLVERFLAKQFVSLYLFHVFTKLLWLLESKQFDHFWCLERLWYSSLDSKFHLIFPSLLVHRRSKALYMREGQTNELTLPMSLKRVVLPALMVFKLFSNSLSCSRVSVFVSSYSSSSSSSRSSSRSCSWERSLRIEVLSIRLKKEGLKMQTQHHTRSLC